MDNVDNLVDNLKIKKLPLCKTKLACWRPLSVDNVEKFAQPFIEHGLYVNKTVDYKITVRFNIGVEQ